MQVGGFFVAHVSGRDWAHRGVCINLLKLVSHFQYIMSLGERELQVEGEAVWGSLPDRKKDARYGYGQTIEQS